VPEISERDERFGKVGGSRVSGAGILSGIGAQGGDADAVYLIWICCKKRFLRLIVKTVSIRPLTLFSGTVVYVY